jgi:hypothetical protein
MRLLAYRAGEDSLVNLLVLGGSWLSVAAAVGRARLAGRHRQRTRLSARLPPG